MVFGNHQKSWFLLIRRSSSKSQKLKILKIWYKKVLSGATKIKDLARKQQYGTFVSAAPPSLIMCANRRCHCRRRRRCRRHRHRHRRLCAAACCYRYSTADAKGGERLRAAEKLFMLAVLQKY